jgi:hypothetical protein
MEQEMTPSDLYCMAMESAKSYELMPQLCKLLDTAYPPKLGDVTPILGVTELTLFINSLEEA